MRTPKSKTKFRESLELVDAELLNLWKLKFFGHTYPKVSVEAKMSVNTLRMAMIYARATPSSREAITKALDNLNKPAKKR